MYLSSIKALPQIFESYFSSLDQAYTLGVATVLIFFLYALVLYFYLEHVQRITFCRCFLIFNQAVFCVDDGVVLWLKIKNPTTTTTTNYNNRSKSYKNYFLDSVKTYSGKKSFKFKGVQLWNRMPFTLKSFSFYRYKKEYKKLLWERYR